MTKELRERAEAVLEIPLTQEKTAILDACDYHLIEGYSWYAKPRGHTCYAQANSFGPSRRSLLMHRLILGELCDGCWVDHINRNGLDNRRANLRTCDTLGNSQNRMPMCGCSPYKGVSWHPRSKMWVARITVRKRRQSLGYYHNEKRAALAYDCAARDHFGEYAVLNFPARLLKETEE